MRNPYKRPNTKGYIIAECAIQGMSTMQAYNALRGMVADQVEPMIFTYNPGGGLKRQPKSHAEQLIELKHAIGRIFHQVGRIESPDFDAPEIDSPEIEVRDTPEDRMHDEINYPEIEEDDSEDTSEEDETEEDDSPERIVAKGKNRILSELDYFEKRMTEIRSFLNRRKELTDENVDDLSTMRPEEAANRLIPRGIPANALLHSMSLHWPKDTRDDAGISDFNVEEFSVGVMKDRGIPERDADGRMFHSVFGYALILAEARQPIFAVGPAGTGKSTLAKQLAAYIFPEKEGMYAETPMTPGATRGDLLGRHTIGGFIPSAFCEVYANGGVFNFEEMDASDASMLIVLNNALAQDSLYNSSNGEKYDRSDDFIGFATGNTFGLGATSQFSGRERLDDATLDRWRMGRLFMRTDENVRRGILFNGIK